MAENRIIIGKMEFRELVSSYRQDLSGMLRSSPRLRMFRGSQHTMNRSRVASSKLVRLTFRLALFIRLQTGKGLLEMKTTVNSKSGFIHSFMSFRIIKSAAKFLWAAQTKEGTAYNLMELNSSSWNCMQALGTSCKPRELHISSCNSMQV